MRLLPWKFIVRRAARHYGVSDPAMLLARLRSFAQPSEVAEPLELLRAGIVFHARGLLNAKAIQHNLDWVWPFWVERQFDPRSPSFVPRAFSFSHINLTHRNWTAVGTPTLAVYPIVDPRGLVTPLQDGWSIDFWILSDRKRLLPSKMEDQTVDQRLHLEPTLRVTTDCTLPDMRLELATDMVTDPHAPPHVRTEVRATSADGGWLVVAVRPYNPEGVQLIHRIVLDETGKGLRVNDDATVTCSDAPAKLRMAHYADGDIYLDLHGTDERTEVTCDVGMATGAALFPLQPGTLRSLQVSVSLERDLPPRAGSGWHMPSWRDALRGTAELAIPDARMQHLYDAAVRTLLLLSAADLVPGPYTYNRFWFRDACLMLHPLLAIGQADRATRILATFPDRQTRAGYFRSQEGEWDSNGQVLWIAARYAALTGRHLGERLEQALRKAVRWLGEKRRRAGGARGTAGLLPAGFSAEHLGPNDFYYWDNYWAWGGLRAIARHWEEAGETAAAAEAATLAGAFAESIQASVAGIPASRARGAIPAAPGRRMDAGAIGSMVADYPLHLYPPADPRMLATAEYLMTACFHGGGFFQEMIHSGVNAYLTLDLAQTLLRAGDPRFADLVRCVAALASPTGQWPEAIHPITHGGCMGDGQHGWAAGEWVMMMRNSFVREEGRRLVVGSGILPEWLESGAPLRFGPTLTPWGPVRVDLQDRRLSIDAQWRGDAPSLEVALPGHTARETEPFVYQLTPGTP